MTLPTEALVTLVKEAGDAAKLASRVAVSKDDGSPVTEADMLSHKLLRAGITKILSPMTPVLSEEDAVPQAHFQQGLAVVIDPLDGTSNFVRGKKNWSVLLGALRDGLPIWGCIYAPEYRLLLQGGTYSQGAWATWREGARCPVARPVNSLQSRFAMASHARWHSANEQKRESYRADVLSFCEATGLTPKPVKFAGLAMANLLFMRREGMVARRLVQAQASGYGDWDLCAWDAILRGGGGLMTDLQGQPIVYGREANQYRHSGFICWREERMATKLAPNLSTTFPPH